MGKGCRQRKAQVPEEVVKANWARCFGTRQEQLEAAIDEKAQETETTTETEVLDANV